MRDATCSSCARTASAKVVLTAYHRHQLTNPATAKKKPLRAFSYQGFRLALRFHFAVRRCSGDPTGIRTRVHTVKGYCPRPLDDRVNTFLGGGKQDRTADLLHAMQALSQLSYTPTREAALYGATYVL